MRRAGHLVLSSLVAVTVVAMTWSPTFAETVLRLAS